MAVFCDLNVPWPRDRKLLVDKIAAAIKLGYETVVINNIMEDIKGKKEKKKEKGKQEQVVIKKPEEVRLDESTLESLKVGSRTVEQYTRLTATLDDASPTHKLGTYQVIKDYDIIAVQPTTEKTFAQVCTTADIDIICLNLTERLPFHLTRTMIGVAIERGIFFEIIYTPAITDASAQKSIISNAQRLIDVGKGKNIIISSGCKKAIDLRSPYDVANLALLFGLTEAQAKDAVSTNCRSVILHAKSRKVSGCVVKMSRVPELKEMDKWKVKKLNGEGEDEEEEEGLEPEEGTDAKNEDNQDEDLEAVKDDDSDDNETSEPPKKKKKKKGSSAS